MPALFRNIGPLELVIILVIVVLLFGAGRIGKIGSELGKGIRNFREAVGEGKRPEGEGEKSKSADAGSESSESGSEN